MEPPRDAGGGTRSGGTTLNEVNEVVSTHLWLEKAQRVEEQPLMSLMGSLPVVVPARHGVGVHVRHHVQALVHLPHFGASGALGVHVHVRIAHFPRIGGGDAVAVTPRVVLTVAIAVTITLITWNDSDNSTLCFISGFVNTFITPRKNRGAL